jgi:hypothetical protein
VHFEPREVVSIIPRFGFAASVEGGKFLLAARKSRHVQKTDYVISLDDDDFNKGSTNYMGKLRWGSGFCTCGLCNYAYLGARLTLAKIILPSY